MSPSHADQELERISRGGIRPLCAGLSLMFLAGAPAIAVMLPPGSATAVAAVVAGVLGLLMAGLWVTLGRWPIPRGSGHVAATGILLIIAAYLVLRGHLQPGPQQTTNFMLLLVGAGALILSTRWYAIAMVAALAAWAWVAIPFWRPDSGPLAFGLVNATILSAVIHVTRRRAMLRLIEARAEVADLALKDVLTGLRNRRALLEIGGEHVAVAHRNGRASTILFFDVDGLKQINDRLGHGSGDTALRLVAAAIEDSFREADLIARIGGDEFVALLPGAHITMETIMPRLNAALVAAGQTMPNARLVVSVGSAVIAPDSEEDLPSAIERADSAMYAHRLRLRGLQPAA